MTLRVTLRERVRVTLRERVGVTLGVALWHILGHSRCGIVLEDVQLFGISVFVSAMGITTLSVHKVEAVDLGPSVRLCVWVLDMSEVAVVSSRACISVEVTADWSSADRV